MFIKGKRAGEMTPPPGARGSGLSWADGGASTVPGGREAHSDGRRLDGT